MERREMQRDAGSDLRGSGGMHHDPRQYGGFAMKKLLIAAACAVLASTAAHAADPATRLENEASHTVL